MPWKPAPPPLMSDENANELGKWAQQQMEQLAAALENPDVTQYNVLHVEPEKPREGQVVVADGTDWDPGDGAGQYMYIGGAWVIQRNGPEPNSYGTVTDGTTPAPANSAGATFKLRAANGVKVTTQNDDGTHGDNALFEFDINAVTQAAPALGDKVPFADVSNSNATRQDTIQKIFDLIGSLTTKSTPDAADFVAIYDVAASAAKKSPKTAFGGKVLISTTSLVGVSGATITVPSGYTDFTMIWTNCQSSSGLGQSFSLRFSDDAGSTWLTSDWEREGENSGTSSTIEIHANMNNANVWDGIIQVFGYASNHRRPMSGFSFGTGAPGLDLLHAMIGFNSSLPINAVRIQSVTQNWSTGSVDLWGTP